MPRSFLYKRQPSGTWRLVTNESWGIHNYTTMSLTACAESGRTHLFYFLRMLPTPALPVITGTRAIVSWIEIA